MRWAFVKVANQTKIHFALGKKTFFYKSMYVMDKTILRPQNMMKFISKIKNVIHETHA